MQRSVGFWVTSTLPDSYLDMHATFPDRFDLKNFEGPRAKGFDTLGHAFQQLVGDGLKEMAGHMATVNPKGPDGSIDGFIQKGARLTGFFDGLPLPCIVECKHNDDSGLRVSQKIRDEWKRLAKRLREKAKKSWSNRDAPWKETESYVYCLSANISLRTKETQEKTIREFFDTLDPEQRPPVRQIRVAGWSDLRPWLETFPTVVDAWLGVQFSAIVDHETYTNQLIGFREYLQNSKLKFVYPESGSPWHPANLVERLEEKHPEPGVLLVAVGGAGKTRVSFETAKLARERGWRVLHVDPAESGVTVDDLAKCVLPRAHRTLLVLDYLDQMEDLNLDGVRRRLIPDAMERGFEIAFLATCRPRWKLLSSPEVNGLFQKVTIKPTAEQNQKVAEAIADQVAPTACQQIGRDKVIHLCGSRPIIALLVAKELERRSQCSVLKRTDFENLRSVDLTNWLRRRLREGLLGLTEANSLLDRVPGPVVAAAAVLACAPGATETLSTVAESSLKCLGYDRPQEANRVVEVLIELGWLERHGPMLATTHDVVADEVIQGVILDGTSVREVELEAILSHALRVPRSLGRFALALRRVIGTLDLQEATNRVQDALVSWMRRNGASLGQSLSAGAPDTTGFTLGSLVAGPPWGDTAIEMWGTLVAPWLEEHGRKKEARHLIRKALKSAKLNCPPDLFTTAVDWLNAHPLTPSASFVLGPLLERTDLGERKTTVIDHALRWLKQNAEHREAVFVLGPLLQRSDLEDNAESAINFSLKWLTAGHFKSLYVAGFVLVPLLEGRKIVGKQAKLAIKCANEWMSRWGDSRGSWSVLLNLLRRPDLPEKLGEPLVRKAIARLPTRLKDENVSLLLGACLLRRVKDRDLGAELVRVSVDWLELNRRHKQADYVFNRLLRRKYLRDAEWQTVAEIAVQWLDITPVAQSGRDHMLNSLLKRPALLSEAALKGVVRHALAWLREPASQEGLGVLLRNLRLVQAVLLKDDQLLSEMAQALSSHPVNKADKAFEELAFDGKLRNPTLSDSEWREHAEEALRWIESAPDNSLYRERALNSLLRRPELLSGEEMERIVRSVFELLDRNLPRRKTQRLLEGLRKVSRKCSDHPVCHEIRHVFARHITNSFDDIVERLVISARGVQAPTDEVLVKEGCELMLSESRRRAPNRAAFAMPALLVIACRIGGRLLGEVNHVAQKVLADRRLSLTARKKVADDFKSLLDENPVSVRDKGMVLLRQLDLDV